MEFDSNDQPVEGTEINMIEVSESQEKPSKSGKKRSAKLAKESEKGKPFQCGFNKLYIT